MSSDQLLFEAVITPHLSLRPMGAIVVVAALAMINLISASAFWLMGAWPVAGFLGLDVVAVGIAFALCHRNARRREEVVLTRAELLIRDVPARGPVRETRLNPYWARLRRQMIADEGVVALDITSHGQSLRIAADLSAPERAEFADALDRALRQAREGS